MFNIEKLMQVLSEIFSDKYGLQITFTATPKEKKEGKEA